MTLVVERVEKSPMPLKSFQNPADKDSLFAYTNSDPLLKRLLTAQPAETAPKAAPAPVMRRKPNGRMVTEAEYKAWRKRGGRWPGEG